MKNKLKILLILILFIFVFVFCYLYSQKSEGIYAKELWLTSQGKNVYGKIFVPKTNKNKYPLIIMSHGFNGNCHHPQMEKEAEYFAKLGYAVYMFDFCGGGIYSFSDGETSDMSVLTEAQNLSDVLSQLQKISYIDKNNIFLFGYSQGGYVSAYVAADRNKEIRGLVLYYPAFNIGSKEWEEGLKKHITEYAYRYEMPVIGEKYFKDSASVDIYEHIKKYKGPVLILHGNEDYVVYIGYVLKAVKSYNPEQVEFKLYYGDGHGLHDSAQKEAKTDSYEFCRKHLKK